MSIPGACAWPGQAHARTGKKRAGVGALPAQKKGAKILFMIIGPIAFDTGRGRKNRYPPFRFDYAIAFLAFVINPLVKSFEGLFPLSLFAALERADGLRLHFDLAAFPEIGLFLNGKEILVRKTAGRHCVQTISDLQ